MFNCGKATPIDLFKVAEMYVSPENGYWGDARGVPYDGNVGNSGIKERQYTVGNIFNTPTSVADTGMYKFYFYFTSPSGYCGIKQGTPFILNLRIGTLGCLEPVSADLDESHYFCYGSSVDLGQCGKRELTKPITVSDLLFQCPELNAGNGDSWKTTRPTGDTWVDVDVYSDRERKNYIGRGDMKIYIPSDVPAANEEIVLKPGDSTFYVIIHKGDHNYVDSLTITVYPKSEINIYYSPEIKLDQSREYQMDEQITIIVDTSDFKFNYYTFFMNNKNLNRYYLGGDTTKNEIILSALAFSGVEDFISVIATDENNCIVRKEDNVKVNVPFPTVFTPDGDGVNDVFLGGEKFRNREFHLEVTNRWGSRLYYGESGWDGTYRGKKVPAGTYMYILIIKTADGSKRTIPGTVTLIRESSR
jgi:gliding motility-associated-like protein